MNVSSGANALSPDPSPEGHFACLPPEVGHRLHVYQLVIAATAGMFAWELAMDKHNMYRILKDRPLVSSVIYMLSRIFTLEFNIFALRFLTVGGDCKPFFLTLTIFWALSSSLSAMLFLFRIWALFRGQTVIIGFFTFLWVCVIGGAMTICLADAPVAHPSNLPGSSLCLITAAFSSFAGTAIIVPVVFDTLVFFAISLRLFPWHEISSYMTWKEQMALVFAPTRLPRFSKALLQGGQQYYLISIAINIFAVAFYFTPSVPFAYHLIVAHTVISVTNAMACKTYCDIRFGRAQAFSSTALPPNTAALPLPIRGGPSYPYLLGAPCVSIPPEAVTTSMRGVVRDPATAGWTRLDAVAGTERGHDGVEYSASGSMQEDVHVEDRRICCYDIYSSKHH